MLECFCQLTMTCKDTWSHYGAINALEHVPVFFLDPISISITLYQYTTSTQDHFRVPVCMGTVTHHILNLKVETHPDLVESVIEKLLMCCQQELKKSQYI